MCSHSLISISFQHSQRCVNFLSIKLFEREILKRFQFYYHHLILTMLNESIHMISYCDIRNIFENLERLVLWYDWVKEYYVSVLAIGVEKPYSLKLYKLYFLNDNRLPQCLMATSYLFSHQSGKQVRALFYQILEFHI